MNEAVEVTILLPKADPELNRQLARLFHELHDLRLSQDGIKSMFLMLAQADEHLRRDHREMLTLLNIIRQQGERMNQKVTDINTILDRANTMTNNMATTLGAVQVIGQRVLSAEQKQIALIARLTQMVRDGKNIDAELEALRLKSEGVVSALTPLDGIVSGLQTSLEQAATDVSDPFPDTPPVVVDPPVIVDPGGDGNVIVGE